jgi:carbon storage regulator CsrA
MLVLSRKYQDKIRIGGNITITVLRIKGNGVRLGIEAPLNVTVIRGELAFNHETESLIERKAIALDALCPNNVLTSAPR